MKRFKRLILILMFFLTTNAFSADERNYVLDNFFATVKEMQTENIPIVTNMEAEVGSEIKLSQKTLMSLQPFISGIFRTSLPATLKGSGFTKIRFKNVNGENRVENMFLYSESDIGSFVLTKSGNNIELYLPRLGIIINDNLTGIREAVYQYIPTPNAHTSFPADFVTSIFNFVTKHENLIRKNIQMNEQTGSFKERKTYLFKYPLDNGELSIEIYDGIWTFATISFNGKDKTFMQLRYPYSQKVEPSLYFPDSITLKGERNNNFISVELSEIRFNLLFTDKDFLMERLNFKEFIVAMYIKFLQIPR